MGIGTVDQKRGKNYKKERVNDLSDDRKIEIFPEISYLRYSFEHARSGVGLVLSPVRFPINFRKMNTLLVQIGKDKIKPQRVPV